MLAELSLELLERTENASPPPRMCSMSAAPRGGVLPETRRRGPRDAHRSRLEGVRATVHRRACGLADSGPRDPRSDRSVVDVARGVDTAMEGAIQPPGTPPDRCAIPPPRADRSMPGCLWRRSSSGVRMPSGPRSLPRRHGRRRAPRYPRRTAGRPSSSMRRERHESSASSWRMASRTGITLTPKRSASACNLRGAPAGR